MESSFTPQQRADLKSRVIKQETNFAKELQSLIAQGMDPDDANALLVQEFQILRQDAFDAVAKSKKEGEWRYAMFIVILIISIIGPIAHFTSIGWYVAVIVLTGICGYVGFRSKPIAGIVACIIFSIALPFAMGYYMEGRERIIRIEFLIPVGIALVPAWLSYYVLHKLVYPNKE